MSSENLFDRPAQGKPPAERTERAHRGWFKLEEEAVRRIETGLEADGEIRFALVAYLTLCRKANLRGNDEFEDGMRSMAKDMAMSKRDAQDALANLKRLGLIDIVSQKVPGTNCSARNRYSLIRCAQYESMCTPNEDTCTERSLLNTAHPFSQELLQELPKNGKKGSRPRNQFTPPSVEECQAEAGRTGMPSEQGDNFYNHHAARGWILKGGLQMKDWRASMRTWKSNQGKFQAERNGNHQSGARSYAPQPKSWGETI